jgi:hypothetical protein
VISIDAKGCFFVRAQVENCVFFLHDLADTSALGGIHCKARSHHCATCWFCLIERDKIKILCPRQKVSSILLRVEIVLLERRQDVVVWLIEDRPSYGGNDCSELDMLSASVGSREEHESVSGLIKALVLFNAIGKCHDESLMQVSSCRCRSSESTTYSLNEKTTQAMAEEYDGTGFAPLKGHQHRLIVDTTRTWLLCHQMPESMNKPAIYCFFCA